MINTQTFLCIIICIVINNNNCVFWICTSFYGCTFYHLLSYDLKHLEWNMFIQQQQHTEKWGSLTSNLENDAWERELSAAVIVCFVITLGLKYYVGFKRAKWGQESKYLWWRQTCCLLCWKQKHIQGWNNTKGRDYNRDAQDTDSRGLIWCYHTHRG